jgi:hypothetical protein
MTVPNRPISREDQSALNDLTWHWDTAYNVAYDGDIWSAAPLTDPDVLLMAETAAELREIIRNDYVRYDRRHWREPTPGSSQ